MTTTTPATREAVADTGRYPSPESRRKALLELAEHVVTERAFNQQPWTGVVPLVVPALASACCPNLIVAFTDLCEAVAERHRFVSDPDGWLAVHGLPLGDRAYDTWDESTEQAVDVAADRLMGVRY